MRWSASTAVPAPFSQHLAQTGATHLSATIAAVPAHGILPTEPDFSGVDTARVQVKFQTVVDALSAAETSAGTEPSDVAALLDEFFPRGTAADRQAPKPGTSLVPVFLYVG